jgi:hypothetical protein
MDAISLSIAIRSRASLLKDAGETSRTVGELEDDGELLMVLARIIEGKDIARAFGSPGDWGYNTPIGRALAGVAKDGAK